MPKFSSPAARRGDKLAALAKQKKKFFRLAALAGPYFIEFDEIDSLIRIFGRAPLINTLRHGARSKIFES